MVLRAKRDRRVPFLSLLSLIFVAMSFSIDDTDLSRAFDLLFLNISIVSTVV